MPKLKLKTIKEICERLSQLQLRRLVKDLGLDADNQPDEVNAEIALVIWTCDLLTVLPLTDPEQFWLIVDAIKSDLLRFGKLLSDYIESKDKLKLPVMYVGLGDRQFVAITGKKEILDLTTAKLIPGNKVQFLETIQYNITSLYMLRLRRYKHLISQEVNSNAINQTLSRS